MIFNPTFYAGEQGEKGKDLYTKLLEERKILLFNEVNDDLACSVIAQLLYLEAMDPDKDITVYINSPGGSVSAGFGIYDTMRKLKCDVSTVCTGMAASMGAFLLAGGTKGKRFATENSEIMIHQVLGGTRGKATDIEIEAKNIQLIKERINKLLAENTGKDIEQVEADTDRNYWMFPEQALEYGLIDGIL